MRSARSLKSVYDADGNVIVTTRFAARPTLAQYDRKRDRCGGRSAARQWQQSGHRFAYDAQNRLRFTVDALGSVSERVYDSLGNVTSTVRFAVRPPLTQYSEERDRRGRGDGA